MVADPKSLLMHYLGLALVSEVGEVTFTLSLDFSQPVNGTLQMLLIDGFQN